MLIIYEDNNGYKNDKMKARVDQKRTNLNPLLLSSPIGKDSLPVKIVLPGMLLMRILMIKREDKLTFRALCS